MGDGEDVVDQRSTTLLPEHIIVAEILPRLHIKPLFSFRCVSKQYNFIISHPKFGRYYMQRAYNTSPELSGLLASITLLFPFMDLSPFRDDFNMEVKDLTETINSKTGTQADDEDEELRCCISVNSVRLPYDDGQQILSSSNGLILSEFERLPKGYTGKRPRFGLFVSNPLTKQCVKIPDPKPLLHPGFKFALVTRRRGDCNDDHAFLTYKVVGIFPKFIHEYRPPHRNAYTRVDVFSSDTGCWATWKVFCPGEIGWLPNSAFGCFAYRGMLHWLDRTMNTVLTYDPYNSPDRFERIPLPKDKCIPYSSLIYSGEEEMLKYCEIERCHDCYDRLSVWRLQDSSKSGCWCFEGEFRVPSLGHETDLLLVAPNPWNRDMICHPYVMYDKFKAMNPRSGTSKILNLFKEIPESEQHHIFSSGLGIWSSPLVPIELCPWSSPFYAQPNFTT